MTIGIGVLCESGTCIILASDGRGTYEQAHLLPNDEMGKQFDLPFNLFGIMAGFFSHCNSYLPTLYEEMEKLKSQSVLYQDHFRYAIRMAQVREMQYRFDGELVKEIGMTLNQWQKEIEHRPRLRRTGRAVIKLTPLVVEMIVGGFINGGPVLLSVVDKEVPEIVYSHETIGSGGENALNHLNFRGQNVHMSFQRTVLHVAEALEAAKLDPHVGEPKDWIILEANGRVRRLIANHQNIKDLVAGFHLRDTDSLEDDKEARKRILDTLYRPIVTPSDAQKSGLDS